MVVFFVAAVMGFRFYRLEVQPYGVRGYFDRLAARTAASAPDGVMTGRVYSTFVNPHESSENDKSGASDELSEQLGALGYLDGYEPVPELIGVTRYDPGRAGNGLNFYVSGHAPEAVLMDMEGNVLHRWRSERMKAPLIYKGDIRRVKSRSWRRAHLYPNGDILAIYEALGMKKLDKNSRLLWKCDDLCHHDVHVTSDGTIYVLTEENRIIPRFSTDQPVLENYVLAMAPNGNELEKISLLECFCDSRYEPMLNRASRSGDNFHTNTIEVFEGDLAHISTLFRKGNVLVSMRNFNTIAIVDLSAEKVVWALSGMWKFQHQPTLLENGNLLLFDNKGHKDESKVIEFDPFTQHVEWHYAGNRSRTFFSEASGSCKRLPNGNTLITESTRGRAFEVTPDNEIVWEFFNPHRAGENDELIATLFELIRIPPGYLDEWWD